MPQTAKAQNLHPKILPFQIFQDASNSKSSKPTSQNGALPNLPRCLKQQKLKTYIPKFCLSKSSKMPQTAKSQNLHPKMVPFQIFQDASKSTSSKPTSQNAAFPNLPTCLKQQELKTYIPKYCLSKSSKMPQTAKSQNLHLKMMPFQIFQDASSSKSSKPTSPNVAFPNLPRCLKQQELKTNIPKGCLCKSPRCLKQQKLKTYIPKYCLSKSSKMPQTAKTQNLRPKLWPFQIFQDAKNSSSSKPTSQDVTFANLPRCLEQQKLKTYIPKCCISKSSNMPQAARAQNLDPKILPFQFFQDASNSKSSKPTSRNLTFPNLPSCLKQQKIKNYIPKCWLSKSSKMPQTAKAQNLPPKMEPFQIFQDASNSKSSKPTSPNVAFPNLPTCLKQQELKTNIPKCCLSKSSKMPQTAKAQNLHPKMVPFQIFQDASSNKSSKTYLPK